MKKSIKNGSYGREEVDHQVVNLAADTLKKSMKNKTKDINEHHVLESQ